MRSTLKTIALTMALSLMLLTGQSALAQAMEDQLGKLENRFFEHQYPKDTADARLERLEKFILGEARTGSDADRLKTLMGSLPDQPAADTPSTAQDPASPPSKNADDAQTPMTASDSIQDSSDYPRVSAIEQKIFGKAQPNLPVQQRLAQLEKKAFGKVSSEPDLSERTAKLEEYLVSRFPDPARTQRAENDDADEADNGLTYTPPPAAGRFAGGGNGSSGSSSGSYGMGSSRGGGSASPGMLRTVESLEKKSLGTTYDGEAIAKRIARLEQRQFPDEGPATEMTLPDRVARLKAAQAATEPDNVAASTPPYEGEPAPGTTTPYSNNGAPSPPPYAFNPNPGASSDAASSGWSSANGASAGTYYGGSQYYNSPQGAQSYGNSNNGYGAMPPGSAYQQQQQQYGSGQSQPQQAYGNGNSNGNGASRGHSMMSGIGNMLGAVGSMAARAVGGYGMGGMGMMYGGNMPYGYGMGSYGMPYGTYGSPYGYGTGSYGSPYGYGNYPGGAYGGMGMPYARPYGMGNYSPFGFGVGNLGRLF